MRMWPAAWRKRSRPQESENSDLPRQSLYAGLTWAYMGDADRAFRAFEAAYRDRDRELPFVMRGRLVGGLRTDVRYGLLLKRMNLPTG